MLTNFWPYIFLPSKKERSSEVYAIHDEHFPFLLLSLPECPSWVTTYSVLLELHTKQLRNRSPLYKTYLCVCPVAARSTIIISIVSNSLTIFKGDGRQKKSITVSRFFLRRFVFFNLQIFTFRLCCGKKKHWSYFLSFVLKLKIMLERFFLERVINRFNFV